MVKAILFILQRAHMCEKRYSIQLPFLLVRILERAYFEGITVDEGECAVSKHCQLATITRLRPRESPVSLAREQK